MTDLRERAIHTLEQLAFFERLLGDNPFKIRAYENGARILTDLVGDLDTLYTSGELAQTKGIGKGILEIVRALKDQQPIGELERLHQLLPPSLLELSHIEGLGPKRIEQLWKLLGISSLGELEYACQENRLSTLKGFGPKLQATISKSIAHLKDNQGQWRLDRAFTVGNRLVEDLLAHNTIETAMLVGPLVQGEETVSGIDILVNTKLAQDEAQALVKQSSIPVTLHVCHTLTDYHTLAEQLTAVTPIIPPRGGARLVRLEDLQGAFHNHTHASDGKDSLQTMRAAAIERGLRYISINDHSKSAFYADGLSEQTLLAQIQEIHVLNADPLGRKCFIFTGTESDILAEGGLDYSDEILLQLDVVVASIHSRLKQNAEQMTARMVQAALHPRTTIVGHPTGRLLLSRSPSDYDMAAFLDACATSGCAVELNSHPQRLDLKASHLAMAKERGVLVAINADAHAADGFSDLTYGIYIARKAGLTPDDILNCRPLPDVKEWLKVRRAA